MGNLRTGSRGEEVRQLQQQLKSMGLYNGNIDGIFGPQTNAAVRAFQQQSGIAVDGIVGPVTRSRMTGQPQQVTPFNQNPAIQQAIANDPRAQQIMNQAMALGDNSLELIYNAIESGDYSGMPFTAQEAQNVLSQQMAKLEPFYAEQKEKATLDLKDSMGLLKSQFDDYLTGSKEQFIDDKKGQDVNAANQGVLFSTGRAQKLNSLKGAYDRDQEAKRRDVSNRITGMARDYQYNFGNSAMSGLNDYFKLGSQNFDAMTPGGSVSSGGISSFYNPSSANFYGRVNTERETNAKTRASSVLNARARKLLPRNY